MYYLGTRCIIYYLDTKYIIYRIKKKELLKLQIFKEKSKSLGSKDV